MGNIVPIQLDAPADVQALGHIYQLRAEDLPLIAKALSNDETSAKAINAPWKAPIVRALANAMSEALKSESYLEETRSDAFAARAMQGLYHSMYTAPRPLRNREYLDTFSSELNFRSESSSPFGSDIEASESDSESDVYWPQRPSPPPGDSPAHDEPLNDAEDLAEEDRDSDSASSLDSEQSEESADAADDDAIRSASPDSPTASSRAGRGDGDDEATGGRVLRGRAAYAAKRKRGRFGAGAGAPVKRTRTSASETARAVENLRGPLGNASPDTAFYKYLVRLLSELDHSQREEGSFNPLSYVKGWSMRSPAPSMHAARLFLTIASKKNELTPVEDVFLTGAALHRVCMARPEELQMPGRITISSKLFQRACKELDIHVRKGWEILQFYYLAKVNTRLLLLKENFSPTVFFVNRVRFCNYIENLSPRDKKYWEVDLESFNPNSK